MEKEISTRMGDGQRIKMSAAQVKEDLSAGTKDAADRGSIPDLPPVVLLVWYCSTVNINVLRMHEEVPQPLPPR